MTNQMNIVSTGTFLGNKKSVAQTLPKGKIQFDLEFEYNSECDFVLFHQLYLKSSKSKGGYNSFSIIYHYFCSPIKK
jgi:hypothetical protein